MAEETQWSMMPPVNDWRHKNLGRLLLSSFRYFEHRLLAGLQQAGFPDVRTAHLSVLRELDLGGTRISEIAQRAGITKQAMGQLVTECERHKLVTVQVDPTDRRAKIVTFTGRGRAIIGAAYSLIVQIEADCEMLVGPRRYATMNSALARIALAPRPPAENDDDGVGATPVRATVRTKR